MGGFGLRGGPLAAVGFPFADSDGNNSAQKGPKDHRGGIVKIVLFSDVHGKGVGLGFSFSCAGLCP